jgi:hypothetical protein
MTATNFLPNLLGICTIFIPLYLENGKGLSKSAGMLHKDNFITIIKKKVLKIG